MDWLVREGLAQLLSKGQLDDCLFLATPEQSAHAAKDRDQQDEQRPHGSRKVRDRAEQNESESRVWSDVSSADGERGRVRKAQ
jgi:hypothetical protein